jgi:hypothetical protein
LTARKYQWQHDDAGRTLTSQTGRFWQCVSFD